MAEMALSGPDGPVRPVQISKKPFPSNENAPKFQSGKYIKIENTNVEVSVSIHDDKYLSYRQQKSKFAVQYWKHLPSKAADLKDELYVFTGFILILHILK